MTTSGHRHHPMTPPCLFVARLEAEPIEQRFLHKYGSWTTIYRRSRRWSEAGVWETVAVTLTEIMADSGRYSIDSTTVRAYLSAAGGKGRLIDALLAVRGGRVTSQPHCLADALG